uniref:Uncharacterized protein n=1 Tax=Oryza nivara TaxID=4536 RepID=A0A0E0HN13_ORYNI
MVTEEGEGKHLQGQQASLTGADEAITADPSNANLQVGTKPSMSKEHAMRFPLVGSAMLLSLCTFYSSFSRKTWSMLFSLPSLALLLSAPPPPPLHRPVPITDRRLHSPAAATASASPSRCHLHLPPSPSLATSLCAFASPSHGLHLLCRYCRVTFSWRLCLCPRTVAIAVASAAVSASATAMTVAAASFVAIANGHCFALRCCCHRRNSAGDRTDVRQGNQHGGKKRGFEELVEQVNRTDELLVELMLGNTCWCIELSKIRSATNGKMVLNEVQTEVYYDKNGITSVMASEYRRDY